MRTRSSWWALVAAAFAAAASADLSAQASLIEHWAAEYHGPGWRPAWMVDTSPDVRLGTDPGGDRPWVHMATQFESLSLGNGTTLERNQTTVRINQPLGSSRHSLRLGFTQDGRSVRRDRDEPLLQAPFVPIVDVGVDLKWRPRSFGEWMGSGTVSWDGGAAGSLGVENSSKRHKIRIEGWRTNARPLVLGSQADSTLHVASESAVNGLSVEGMLSLPGKFIRPTASVRWETSSAAHRSVDRAAFLTISPSGELGALDLGLSFDMDRSGFALRHRRESVDLDGSFHRREQGAGRLFIGRSELTRWALELWREQPRRRWSLQVGNDELEGALSTRFETWPFVALWEQLGATAFRYRGSVVAKAQWLRVERVRTADDPAALGWALNAGRYVVETSQEDWLVTSLGFGRAERHHNTWKVDPAFVIGGEITKPLHIISGAWVLSLSGAIPVYANTETEIESESIPRQLRVGITWAW